ncbi:MAG: Gfo/Idh/MocA family oxidoreductase [Fibrobacteria bacterium]|nr:Gfo/Idh/MocA family oxidoreductase [Fibrobacteria bacterium]
MISIALIGVGRWGPNLINSFNRIADSEVKIVCDLEKERLKPVSSFYPKIKVTTDTQSVFNDASIDCIVICTPLMTHFKLAKQALETGHHVFVEKPLAASSLECSELIEIAEKQKKILFVGHTFKYNSGIQAAKDYISKGELGKILFIDANRTNLGPIRYDANALWDLASHDISIFSYWLDAAPKAVSSSGSCFYSNTVEDVVYATFSYKDNITAHVHASWLNPRKTREITVVGEKKMLIWNDMNLSECIRIYNKGFEIDMENLYQDNFDNFRLSIKEGDVIIPSIKHAEPLLSECRHFVDCVVNGKQPLTDGQDGLMVVKALEAATKSMQQNNIKIDIN